MTTERGREQAERRLVAAARMLFAQRGPSAVSLRDVAREAGVNHGLIYHYIGTREDLLNRVFADSAAETVAAFQASADPHAAMAQLRQMCDQDHEWVRLLAWTILTDHAESLDQAAAPMRAIFDEQATDTDREAIAMLMLHTLALDLFGDFVQSSVGLAEPPEAFRSRMLRRVEGQARA